MRALVLLLLLVGALCAPKDEGGAPDEQELGEKVAVALEKYAEYMVEPKHQHLLLERVKKETEREVEEDVRKPEGEESVVDYMVHEMGSAKDVLTGFPMILDSVDECEAMLEDLKELRKKRGIAEWFQQTVDKIKDAAKEVKEFFNGDVRSFVKDDIPEAADKVSTFFKHNFTKFVTEDVKDFFKDDVPEFFKNDVKNFFDKDVKDFFTNDVKDFFVNGYEEAMKYFGLQTEEGRSTFQERMDDFLSTTRKGLAKAAKFGFCVVKKNLNNPLLKIITTVFV